MKTIRISIWIFLGFLSLNQAQAEIYKCTTNSGQVKFSDTPCPTQKQKCFLSNGELGDECEAEVARRKAKERRQSHLSNSARSPIKYKAYADTTPTNSSSETSHSSYESQESSYRHGYSRHIGSFMRSLGGSGRRR